MIKSKFLVLILITGTLQASDQSTIYQDLIKEQHLKYRNVFYIDSDRGSKNLLTESNILRGDDLRQRIANSYGVSPEDISEIYRLGKKIQDDQLYENIEKLSPALIRVTFKK